MNVLLIKPYNLSDHIQPALGLGYLATVIRDRHDVAILDCIKNHIKPNRFSAILEQRKPDVVGIQCYTFDLYNVREYLRVIKESKVRDIVTVLGGPHPSVMPVDTMNYFGPLLDFCFVGEAETGFPQLLDLLKERSPTSSYRNIPGLVWRSDGHVVANSATLQNDLDSLGMPAWDLIHPETYPECQHGAFYKKFPIAPLETTRGCPYQCTFCSAPLLSGRKIRKRSVAQVIEEINLLYHTYGIREFHIIDDNFTMDKQYAKALIQALIETGLDISWATPNGVRMSTLDRELLELMKQSGLYLISLGIESGSDRILKKMKKSITVEKIRTSVSMIREVGIDIAGFFILGFPGEQREDIEATIRFALELDLIRANFFTFLPFPGTESYDELKKTGELDNVDWERFYFMNAAYTPRGLTRRELKWLQRRAFAQFFLRPRILWKNITAIQSLRHFTFLLKRFFHWIVMK